MSFSKLGVFLLAVLALSGVLLRATTVLDYIPLSIDGKPVPLATYRGKVLLIVNVASHSNFTPQYEGLEGLPEKYKVTFPIFAKVPLAGEHMAPLYQFLTDKQANPTTGGPIRWNFTKFLVDREGKVVERFEPDVPPDSPELAAAI